jgi:hypothetical protein
MTTPSFADERKETSRVESKHAACSAQGRERLGPKRNRTRTALSELEDGRDKPQTTAVVVVEEASTETATIAATVEAVEEAAATVAAAAAMVR